MRADYAVETITHLGYPVYILTILGAWKLLGGALAASEGMGVCRSRFQYERRNRLASVGWRRSGDDSASASVSRSRGCLVAVAPGESTLADCAHRRSAFERDESKIRVSKKERGFSNCLSCCEIEFIKTIDGLSEIIIENRGLKVS